MRATANGVLPSGSSRHFVIDRSRDKATAPGEGILEHAGLGDVFRSLAHDRLGQHGRGRGAVASFRLPGPALASIFAMPQPRPASGRRLG